eukprot:gnl/Dysnectes_brevis/774_a852_4830.p1 GENE.gnl/Dysnectes_brevis/774_a852_4830~~gnl/Dysnectes_brevis/774_a852_4830.p1  ORF type:complete len:222 (+),score=37.01 gnl/Dysnectes_brevis/774_a852_4830:26-691(+)
MEECECHEDDILRGIEKFNADIATIDTLPNIDEKYEVLEQLAKDLDRIRMPMDSIGFEIPDIQQYNPSEASKWTAKLEEFDERITSCRIKLTATTQAVRREGIAQGADLAEGQSLTSGQKLAAATALASADVADLDHAIDQMVDVNTINDAVLTTLDGDLLKLNRVADSLDDIQTDTELARKQLRDLLRRLAGDKCILVLILIIVIACVVSIVMQLVSKAK